MLSDKTMAYGEPVTTALLGVDALYRAESGDEEGIVVVNMAAQTDLVDIVARFDPKLVKMAPGHERPED